MNAHLGKQYKRGCEALDHALIVNVADSCVEMHAGEKGESKVVRKWKLMSNEVEGWREHNQQVMKEIYSVTYGGSDRYVDPKIIRAWESIGLASHAARLTVDGRRV